MAKFIRCIFKNEHFGLSECNDGYYLYDYVVGMNISMRAKTEQDAFKESLGWYQKRLVQVKNDYKELNDKVESFLSQFPDRENE